MGWKPSNEAHALISIGAMGTVLMAFNEGAQICVGRKERGYISKKRGEGHWNGPL